MNLSPVNNNVAFGKVYAVFGPKEKVSRLESVLTSDNAYRNNLVCVDATNTYRNIRCMRSMNDVFLRNQAREGNKVGFVLTDEDSNIAYRINNKDEEQITSLNQKSDMLIDLDDKNIPNFF